MKKAFFSLLLCIIFSFSSANIFASEVPNEPQYPERLDVLNQVIGQFHNNQRFFTNTESQQIVITDRDTIDAIAKEQNLEDPDSIKEIRFDAVYTEPNISFNDTDYSTQAVKTTFYIGKSKDLGTGYIYNDNYMSHIFTGPADVDQSFSKSDKSAITGSLGLEFKSLVEAKFGVSVDKTTTQTTTYKFKVPAKQKIELKVFTNYQKIEYELWRDVGGLGYYYKTDNLYKAVGLYFQQVVR